VKTRFQSLLSNAYVCHYNEDLRYPDPHMKVRTQVTDPPTEVVSLDDYRRRYRMAGLCVALHDAHWSAMCREPMPRDFVASSSNRCWCLWCRPGGCVSGCVSLCMMPIGQPCVVNQ
jgi:hypothetical protein